MDLYSNDVKTHILSDNSGYYVIINDSSRNTYIIKYVFSGSTANNQQISSINYLTYGQLMISDTEFFFVGSDVNSPYSLYFYKIKFQSTSADWK